MNTKHVTVNPSTDTFPYFLEVNDNHNPDGGIAHYPREGYAQLLLHDTERGVMETVEYIQEQSFPDDSPVESHDIHAPLFPHQLPEHHYEGWETSPSTLWDFIETIRDDYYERGIDASTLPVRVITHRHSTGTGDGTGYTEYCEIYFRNGANDAEYLMWNSDELYGPRNDSTGYVVNSELVQKVLAAVGRAYETPNEFLDKWGDPTQLTH